MFARITKQAMDDLQLRSSFLQLHRPDGQLKQTYSYVGRKNVFAPEIVENATISENAHVIES